MNAAPLSFQAGSSDCTRSNSLETDWHSILLSITNKMQHYTVFLITVNALHVSGGFCAHHQELKTVHTASGICQACLLLQLVVGASKQISTFLSTAVGQLCQ
jgi:hypothetical protein